MSLGFGLPLLSLVPAASLWPLPWSLLGSIQPYTMRILALIFGLSNAINSRSDSVGHVPVSEPISTSEGRQRRRLHTCLGS